MFLNKSSKSHIDIDMDSYTYISYSFLNLLQGRIKINVEPYRKIIAELGYVLLFFVCLFDT